MHEIKFDGYRLQLRVEDGKATLKTRKGLDWTTKFQAIADVAEQLPDCMIDGEACALDKNGRAGFRRPCRRRCPKASSQDLVFFAFDLMFADGEDLRQLPLVERKARLQELLGGLKDKRKQIRYVEHLETAGDAVLASACRWASKASSPSAATRPIESTRSSTWPKAKCRGGQEVIIGGWTQEGRKLRSLIVGVHRGKGRTPSWCHVGRVGTGFSEAVMRKLLPELKKVESKTSPFAAGVEPAQGKQHALGAARAGCRDRVRRLDRRRQCAAGCVQGPARRQAGRGDRSREARQTGEDQGGAQAEASPRSPPHVPPW